MGVTKPCVWPLCSHGNAVPARLVDHGSGKRVCDSQLLTRHQRWVLRRGRGRLGEAAELKADVVKVAINIRAPRSKLPHSFLQCRHSVIAFVADLSHPDELDIDHVLL